MNLFDKCKKGVDTFRGRHRSRQTPTDIYRQTWAHKISSAIFGACLHMPDVFDQIGAVSESLVSIDCNVEIMNTLQHIFEAKTLLNKIPLAIALGMYCK